MSDRPSREHARTVIQSIIDSIPIINAEHPMVEEIMNLVRKSLQSVLVEDKAIGGDDERALKRFGIVLSGFAGPVGSQICLYRKEMKKRGRDIKDGELVQVHAAIASLGAAIREEPSEKWPKPVVPCEGATFRRARQNANGDVEIYDNIQADAKPIEVK